VLNNFIPAKLKDMKINMNKTDRALRLLIATVLIALIISRSLSGAWEIVLWIVSIIFIATAFIGSCPLYKLLGINKDSRKKKVIMKYSAQKGIYEEI
jgi:predicted Na+-dependent transporter